MKRGRRRARRLLGLGTVMALLLLACPGSSQAVWMPYPGLPEPVVDPYGGEWYWVQQAGMSESAKAKQWVAVPPLTLVSYGGFVPQGATELGKPVGDAAFVSPPGAPEPYGYMPPIRVRTVGFGLLPAEATMQISQRRTADGKVVPVHAELRTTIMPDGTTIAADTVIEDAFDVRVTRVTLDGVDIGLTGDCRTARPAPVRMVGPGYTVPAGVPNEVEYILSLGEENYFHPMLGGQLSGTIEIPPFTGCTTKAGDDLSPMLTLSASGPGNKVIARARACHKETGLVGAPPAPGDWDRYPFPEPGHPALYAYCLPFTADSVPPYPERGGD